MAQDKQIVVEGAPNEGRVILWEKDPIHPDGEVFITEGQQVTVGVTPNVTALLKIGKLIEIKGGTPKAKKAEPGDEEGDPEEHGTPPTGNKVTVPTGTAVSSPATGSKPATVKIATN